MVHVLQKIIVDDANAGYAHCWNQQFIRPCKTSYDEIIEAEENQHYKSEQPFVLNLEGAVCFQKDDESESEFLLRAAIEGVGPEFEMRLYRDAQWHEYLIDFVDLLKNKVLYHSTLLDKKTASVKRAMLKAKREAESKKDSNG